MMRIFANWHTKLLAVAIAFVLWAAVQGFKTDETNVMIPIALENVPADVVVTEQSVDEVNVRLMGSRAALRRADEEELVLPISLSGVKVGQVLLAVDPERIELPRGAQATAHSPTTVQFRVEPRLQKNVPVRAEVVGTLPDGYRLSAIEVTPQEIAVTGPKRAVEKIRRLETDRIDLSEVRDSSERAVRVVLQGDHVELVNGSDTVRVRLEIEAPGPDPSETEAESAPVPGTGQAEATEAGTEGT